MVRIGIGNGFLLADKGIKWQGWAEKGILGQKEENLCKRMNFAVGNVEKVEKISDFLKKIAKKISKKYCIFEKINV